MTEEKKQNNFDAIRLGASLMVVFAHSFPLLGYSYNYEPLYCISQTNDFGHLGVSMFLFISGFLISRSVEKSNSFNQFIFKRLLRMIPALLILVFFTTFVIGPLFTTISLKQYFQNDITYNYLKNCILFRPQYVLPEVFNNCPEISIVNGSLWTLGYEFSFYIFLYFLFQLLKSLKIKLYLSVILVIVSILILNFYKSQLFTNQYTFPILNLNIQLAIDLFIYFMTGVLFYLFKLKQNTAKSFFLIGISLSFLVLIKNEFINSNIFYLIVPLITYSVAFSKRINFKKITQNGDYSYGIYLYAFLIQQCIISLLPTISNPYFFFLLSAIIAYVFGYCSWHFIEKKVINLKSN